MGTPLHSHSCSTFSALPPQFCPPNPSSSSFIKIPLLRQSLSSAKSRDVTFGLKLAASSSPQNSTSFAESRRKVVEHICLIKAKEGLSDEEEKDMLDHLYTSQYHMSGILSISLGRISDQEKDGYTHAVYMRFQRKEDLTKFYENPSFTEVLKDQVFPLCNELLYVDFESQVQDDMMLIFRKGEEFNSGVELVLLIEFAETAIGGEAEDALVSLGKLIEEEYPNLIVQATQGCNFNSSSKEYTHGIVIRFRSTDAMEIFMGSREYQTIWSSKFEPICYIYWVLIPWLQVHRNAHRPLLI